MFARIYQPARNAMKSGVGKTHLWVLEFAPQEKRRIDPLMGWTGSGETAAQIRLSFETREEAEAYAREQGWPYVLTEPNPRKHRPRAYGDNFATRRRGPWTH